MRSRPKKPQLRTDPQTSARLGRIRQHGTKPELAVRRVLYDLGLRYRVNNRDLPGSPDVANRKKKWAVFVHGCFWHAHEGCAKATVPKRNREFWLEKFQANRERDARAVGLLEQRGYRVITVWECEAATLKDHRERLARIRDRQTSP